MARTKKTKVEVVPEQAEAIVHTPIEKLPIDYPSEGLNNMARKINEIIDRLN